MLLAFFPGLSSCPFAGIAGCWSDGGSVQCRIALDRSHAEIAVGDTKVAAAFRAECRPTWEDGWCVLPHLSVMLQAFTGSLSSAQVEALAVENWLPQRITVKSGCRLH